MLFITLIGAMEPIERGLIGARFALDQREASGTVTVVQIDARSMREFGVWPFPRAAYADAIDRLREAGASSIAFDVELARSPDDEDNQALVDALERAGGSVVLPSFIQLASAGQSTNQTIRTEPADIFREHAWLANVNVYPSPDGRIWTMTYGGWVDDKFQYSLAATLAGRAIRDTREFYVDYGINLASIPRLSFVDLINGEFDPEKVAGKQIIVGGTAVELGDQLNVPRIGIVSGPVLQALAFETIYQHREIWRTNSYVTAAIVLVTLVFLCAARRYMRLTTYLMLSILFCFAIELAALLLQQTAAVALDTAPALATAAMMAIAVTMTELDSRRVQVAQERLEKENRGRMFDRVIEDSFDGLIIFRSDWRIEGINAAARKILEVDQNIDLFGCELDEILPKGRIRDINKLPPDIFERFGALQELSFEIPSGAVHTIEFVITQSDLENTDRKSQTRIYTVTFRDITERRSAQKERDAALQEALAANRAKTQFLANMSHELRTPLNAIIGFSEIMNKQMLGALGSEQYVGYALDIENSGRHLLSIVNDILDVSRVETGEFELNEEEVNVDDLLQTVHRLSDGWSAAHERNIQINVETGMPALWADHRLCKQMVLNLLSNAVKFSPAGSRIDLCASMDPDGKVTLQVKDEGIGIPEDCIADLTKAFYQVDGSLEREFEGSGLGLTLVQKHIDLHGGTLTFESAPGSGTIASLRFPSERTCQTGGQSQSA